MIIFGDQKKEEITKNLIQQFRILAYGISLNSSISCDKATELLISFGEFECGVTDFYSNEIDFYNPLINLLRKLGFLSGKIFNSFHNQNNIELKNFIENFLEHLSTLENQSLPVKIKYTVPEGYAYYGLYPEFYIEAANKFYTEINPEDVTAIGIRSIGTSLSSVVAAALDQLGCDVFSFTVRPRGDYFNRYINISDELKNNIWQRKASHFLIVDEGPGLSGSSMNSVAEVLSLIGIPDEKIILFPSWNTNGEEFQSEKAKVAWKKYRKFVTTFEDYFDESSLQELLGFKSIKDISAGKWRNIFLNNPDEVPAFHKFEKRKYLCSNNGFNSKEIYFAKYAGQGKYGKTIFQRGIQMAEAGFSPEALQLKNGFIFYKFIDGNLLINRQINSEILFYFARYLNFIRENFPAESTRSADEIIEMINVNIEKGINKDLAKNFMKKFSFPELQRAFAVDGRMMPHEWIKSNGNLYKTDNCEHFTDHSFSGCQDIAWDLAGLIIEFNLNATDKKYLIDCYKELSKDETIFKRINFYIIAYCAFRLGYVLFAEQNLTDNEDKRSFNNLSWIYTFILKYHIS